MTTAEPRAPTPTTTAPRAVLAEEVLVVLSLSLLASAVFSLLDLLSRPIHGVIVSTYANVGLATQLAQIVFGLAPVALVVHLARRTGEGVRPFGLSPDTPGPDVALGIVLGVAVALAGGLLYVGAVALGVNRFVVPVPPLGHWWTYPVLLLGAAQAGLLEEVVVAGYLIRRLEQLRFAPLAAIGTSALLRAAYHLYQGWGGFTGNLALGVLFGAVFWRWRRTWPLVVAHTLVDVLAGIVYIAARGRCPFGVCIR